jgi:hypothetical protein
MGFQKFYLNNLSCLEVLFCLLENSPKNDLEIWLLQKELQYQNTLVDIARENWENL